MSNELIYPEDEIELIDAFPDWQKDVERLGRNPAEAIKLDMEETEKVEDAQLEEEEKVMKIQRRAAIREKARKTFGPEIPPVNEWDVDNMGFQGTEDPGIWVFVGLKDGKRFSKKVSSRLMDLLEGDEKPESSVEYKQVADLYKKYGKETAKPTRGKRKTKVEPVDDEVEFNYGGTGYYDDDEEEEEDEDADEDPWTWGEYDRQVVKKEPFDHDWEPERMAPLYEEDGNEIDHRAAMYTSSGMDPGAAYTRAQKETMFGEGQSRSKRMGGRVKMPKGTKALGNDFQRHVGAYIQGNWSAGQRAVQILQEMLNRRMISGEEYDEMLERNQL